MAHTIDKIAWILIVDGRLLSTRSRGKDTYYLPGGKREPGETDQQCLIREIREELGVELVPATLEYAGQFADQAHGQGAGVGITMTCYRADYVGTLSACSEIEELIWLGYADRHKTSPVHQQIFDWLKAQDLIT
ncbi:MAG: NUDIX domain-containing protein [Herpetosiphonaceae bacterium]|nr:NUDIX domain-containing protein [Herpetosiphonaceae bacterium]